MIPLGSDPNGIGSHREIIGSGDSVNVEYKNSIFALDEL